MAVLDAALIASTALLGAASVPHCALMCGSACTALTAGNRGARQTFHLLRLASYAAAGALAAASVQALHSWSLVSRGLSAVWVLLHAALLVFGACLLIKGQLPRFSAWRIGRSQPTLAGGWHPMRGPVARAGLAGAAWVMLPCATLQGALVLAALASRPMSGALAMAAFALASGAGLWLAPLLWRRISAPHWLRLAGIPILAAAAWALVHDLQAQAAPWCT